MDDPTTAGYELEFADDFDGTDLDRTKWFPYLLPHWSDLASAAARYTVGDGVLRLLIERDQGRWRAGPGWSDRASNLATGNWSGPVGTTVGQFAVEPGLVVTADVPIVRTWTPRFGFLETRLKAVPIVGYHVALWLIGFDEPHAGEIRAFEIHGGQIGPSRSRIDSGILRWADPALRDELYEDVVPIDASDWHVYGLEWTKTDVSVFVDGARVRRIGQSPQYPMQVMFGLYERPHEVIDDGGVWPRALEVDWFRGYRRIGGG